MTSGAAQNIGRITSCRWRAAGRMTFRICNGKSVEEAMAKVPIAILPSCYARFISGVGPMRLPVNLPGARFFDLH